MKSITSTLRMILLTVGVCCSTVQADLIAFIYDDSPTADSYEGFLEGLGYNVQTIHVDEVAHSNLTPFGLIMIGPDIGSGYDWGPDEAVTLIQNSDKPVLGLGRGGARLFQEMGLDINWGNSAVGSYDSMYVPNPNHPFFKSPFPIPLSEGVVRLFYSEHACVGEYSRYMPSDVLQLGHFYDGSLYRPLVKQNKYVLLGFVATPDDMREVGLALLVNIVYNLYEQPGIMYGVNASSNGLSRINWATGDSEFIGPLDPDPDIYLTPIAMAIRSSDNTIFVWNNSDQGQPTGVLLTVNPQTGRATPVNASTPAQGQISALAFGSRGLLFGLDYSLYSISTSTGARELISSLEGHRVAAAECFDGKTIYALTFAQKLLTIDPFSGSIGRELDLNTDIGIPGSLCYDATSSQLIGSGLAGPEGDILFDLNPYTGEVSNIRTVKNGSAPQGMGIAVPPPPPLYISLNVEDALEGVPVNKVVGDVGSGPTNYTRAEVTTKLASFSSSARHNIPVILDTHGTALGSPLHVWLREGVAGDLTEIPYDNLGGGRYRVNVDLNAVTLYPGFTLYYYQQIVWHFLIPSSTTPQNVSLTAEIDRPCVDPYANGLIRILSPGSVRSLIVTNRQLLYDNYSTSQVTSLLQRLFAEAQGFPSSSSPIGVIYYAERYTSLARDWDNTTVDYTSEATANVVPNAIDDVIEDWVDDATKYNTITLPIIGSFTYPVSMPQYLLIVGDDHIIPFYRNYDTYTAGKSEDNWTVNSATNPWITATDENYFFTDNPYGDLYGGNDWEEGDVELWVGRLLGDSAADMHQLLAEGVNRNNGQRGGIVMASVDGWEVGLEPDDGRSGEIADLTDVTAILRSKGFVVRNDDVPSSEIQTIDVMSPWEGGSASWNTHFHNAANHAGGMDLFFVGGHDGYDHAEIPDDDFSPDDTPGDYTRFDDDHPIAMIVGCHGGLPVPDIHVPGGVDNSMVYDVIHEGARGYIGATGYSYGSPGNLHKNLWAERLMQHFFINLVEPLGVNSMTVGKALSDAKNDFVFAYGSNDDLDRKTVTEYCLYGVPWSFLWYPNAMAGKMESMDDPIPNPVEITGGTIQQEGDLPTYTQSFTVKVGKYHVEEEPYGHIVYELVKVEGGTLAVAPGLPILPYAEGHRLVLPYGASVTGLKVLDMSSQDIGRYNIPIAAVEPWSEGGLAYTQKTDIDYLYPAGKQLVQYQQVGNEVLLTLFPIQHNPATDETVYHSSFIVQVTYESPLPVVVTDMTTESETYLPGEDIHASAMVHNITDEQLQLDWTLVLKDTFGQVQSRTIGKPFYLPSGEMTEMNMSLGGAGAAGSYTVELSLVEEKQAVGGASTGVTVADGEILSVSAQEVIPVGEYGAIEVTFANHSTEKVSAQFFLTVQDSGGGIVEDLPYQQVGIAGQSSKTVEFLWMPTQAGSGQFSAVASVVANEHVYGPATDTFAVQDCPLADLSGDCDVDFEDFSILCSQWLEKTCTEPDWCMGADMDKSQSVDSRDLLALTEEWLDGVTP